MLQKRLKTVKTSVVTKGMQCGTVLTTDLNDSMSGRTGNMMGKSIPLNNVQWEEWIFIVTGWYLDKVKRVHVPCNSDGVINILSHHGQTWPSAVSTERKGGEQQSGCTLFYRRESVEHALFCPQDTATLRSWACCSHWHKWNSCWRPSARPFFGPFLTY